MKNTLKKIFLDKDKTDLFTQYLLKKQYIDKYIDGEKINYDEKKSIYKNYSLTGIKKLFIILTLYEEIDFMRANYDYDRIFNLGLSEINRSEWNGYGTQEVIEALHLLNISREKVISTYKKKYNKSVDINEFKRLVFDMYIPIAHKYSHKNVNEIFLEVNRKVYEEEKLTDSKVDILFFINQTMNSLVEGLGFSSGFYTDIFRGSIDKNPKIVEDMYYICKINLPKEVNILPAPQTLSDVIEIRKSPYIKSFREVFSGWMSYIQEGDINLANKIERDVIKANSYFTRLKKYHKFINHPFVCTCVFAGGFIPIVSEMINVSTYVGGMMEYYLTERNNWVLISDSNS